MSTTTLPNRPPQWLVDMVGRDAGTPPAPQVEMFARAHALASSIEAALSLLTCPGEQAEVALTDGAPLHALAYLLARGQRQAERIVALAEAELQRRGTA